MPSSQVTSPRALRCSLTRCITCCISASRLLMVPGISFRISKDGENRVADELVHGAAVMAKDTVHQAKIFIQHGDDVVAGHVGGQACETSNIGAQNRHHRELATERQPAHLREESGCGPCREIGQQSLKHIGVLLERSRSSWFAIASATW